MATANEYAMIGSVGSNLERVPVVNRTSGIQTYDELYDDTETNIDLIKRLYRNSDRRFALGAWVIKPIIEIILHFMGIPTATSKDSKLEEVINDFYSTRRADVVQLFRELGMYGKTYAVIGWDGVLKIPTLSVRNKNAIVDIRYEDINHPKQITYVRIREIVKIVSNVDEMNVNEDSGETKDVIYDKVFWKEVDNSLDIDSDTEEGKMYFKLLQKTDDDEWSEVIATKENPWGIIPVVELNQGMLSDDSSGYGDVSALIPLIGAYHQVLEGAIDTNIYNGKPTLVFSGLENSRKFIAQMYGYGDVNSFDSEDVMQEGMYDAFGAYYLEGTSKIEYLQTNDTVSDAKQLLQLLFYIFVQVSGVPEWAMGAEMNATYASTKMQATPLVQKIDTKRDDISDGLIEIHSIIAHIYEKMNDVEFSTYVALPEWDEVMPDDKDYLISALGTIIPLDVLSHETILRLLGIVSDPEGEVAKRLKEKQNEKLNDDDTNMILNSVKDKLSKEGGNGETSDVSKLDAKLKSLLGDNYLEELGVDENE